MDLLKYLGKHVKFMIDRPLNSAHPNDPNFIYKLNYGYIPNLFADDEREQDVYILDHLTPLNQNIEYLGKCIAIIFRKDDVENKLCLVIKGKNQFQFNKKKIFDLVYFQEQYFNIEISL